MIVSVRRECSEALGRGLVFHAGVCCKQEARATVRKLAQTAHTAAESAMILALVERRSFALICTLNS